MKSFLTTLHKIMIGIIAFFSLFGILMVLINVIYKFFDEDYNQIASGSKYILITLGLFVVFCVFQYRQLKNDLRIKDGKKRSISLWIAKAAGYFGIFLTILFFIAHFGPEWLQNFSETVGPIWGAPAKDANIVYVIFVSFAEAGIMAGMYFAAIIYLFRMGLFTSGLAFCIAIHNYFNGQGFDLSTFYNLFLESTLPEIWGFVISIGQILLTLLVTRLLKVETTSPIE